MHNDNILQLAALAMPLPLVQPLPSLISRCPILSPASGAWPAACSTSPCPSPAAGQSPVRRQHTRVRKSIPVNRQLVPILLALCSSGSMTWRAAAHECQSSVCMTSSRLSSASRHRQCCQFSAEPSSGLLQPLLRRKLRASWPRVIV